MASADIFADILSGKAAQEPSLKELLNDPIAQMLMRMDGVERSQLEPLLDRVTLEVQSRDVALLA